MSQADELLDSLPEDEVSTYSVDHTTEPHILINEDRSISVPNELKHIAVQGEHNIETVTFDCPRYWDGHDLSAMNMRINYQRPDGHCEPCPVENLRVDETDTSMIHFDWTISGNVTAVKGNVSFMVCAKLSNADGIREREWHSRLNQDLIVDEGMDCSGEEIVEQNPDILESILVRLDHLESTGGVTDEQIANAIDAYLRENPIEAGVDEQEVRNIIAAYLEENPIEGGTVTDEQIASAVAAYLVENPVEITDVVKTINGVSPDVNGNVEIPIPDSGQNYTLPVATETVLGGVKLLPKTAAHTEQATVDENGNVWVKPPSTSVSEVGGVEFKNHVGNLNSGVIFPKRPKAGEHIADGTTNGTCMAFRAYPGKSYVFTAPTMSGKGSWGQADAGGICTHPISALNMPIDTAGMIREGGLGKYFVFNTNANMAENTRYLLFIGVISDTEAPNLLIYEGDSIEGYDTINPYSADNGTATSDNMLVRRSNLSEDVLAGLRNADTAVQPEDLDAPSIGYVIDGKPNYNIFPTLPGRPVGYSAHAAIQEMLNSAEVSTQFLTNQIGLDEQDRYAHCPAVVVIGDTAYIAAFMNTQGGDRYDVVTAKTMLYVVDIPTMTQTAEYVVAENGNVAGDLVFHLGSGACNCVLLNGIVHVNFVAKLSDDIWHQLYREFNPTTGEWSDIGFCQIQTADGSRHDFTTPNVSAYIQEIPKQTDNTGLTINTNIVGQYAEINGVYYVAVGARDQWANMPILKTADWVVFEHFATPGVDGNDAHFEMAVASDGVGTLYTATRQISADKLVLMKVNATTGAVTGSGEIVDGNRSRPYIYKSGQWLYVAHILTKNRLNSSQISVLRANSLAYERCLTLPPMVYPAFAPYNGGIFAAYMVPYRLCATKFTVFEPYGALDAVSALAHMMRLTQT